MFVPLEILPGLLYCEKYLPVALESAADVQRMRRTVSVKLQHASFLHETLKQILYEFIMIVQFLFYRYTRMKINLKISFSLFA